LAALVKGKRMTQKEAPFDTFILGEGDTAQEAVQEEIPSSSPSLPPHYHLPPPFTLSQHTPCPAPLHFCLSEGLVASLDRRRTGDTETMTM